MVKRSRSPTDPIEKVNRESDESFLKHYLGSTAGEVSPWTTSWTHPGTNQKHQISFSEAGRLTDEDFQACFELIAETSRRDYEGSSLGWHPVKKRKEMRSPELRYILVKDDAGFLCGFTSLMPTWEEGQAVVYCYEIHLKPEVQSTGLGRLLMGFHFTVAKNIPTVHKNMLTCFLSNAKGLAFYERLGFTRDEISPRPRNLRGKVVHPDYVIMSRAVHGKDLTSDD